MTAAARASGEEGLATGAGLQARAALLEERFESFLFHYAIGGQLARYVRLSNKFAPTTPASFLGSFVLSSTVLWQCLDAMMYRMRAHRFVLLKPIVLLAVLPLERSLCRQACDSMPGMAHHFTSAAELVGLLVAPFRPVPPPPLAVANRSVAGTVLSCTKVQAFMLALLTWVLPSFVLRRLERQMLKRFAEGQRQLVASAAPRLASSSSSHGGSSAGLQNCGGGSSRRRGSSSSSARPPLLRRIREARQVWQLQWVQEQLQREQHAAEEPSGSSGGSRSNSSGGGGGGNALRSRWEAWAVPLLLTGLCWHAIDTLLW